MMSKQKLLKKVTSWLIAFVCSVVLSISSLLLCIYLTLFNENFMLHIVKQTNYSQILTDEIQLSLADLSRASNIPPSIIKDSVATKDINQNVQAYIHAIYHGDTFKLLGENQLKNTLYRQIEDYAKEKKLTIDQTSQQAIDTFVQQASQRYQQFIEIPYLLIYGNKVMSYKRQLLVFLGGSALAFVLLLTASLHFTSHLVHRRLRLCAAIFGGAGLMLVTLPIYILLSNYIKRLAITTKPFYQFITTYLSAFTLSFIYLGIVLLILYVIFIGLSIWQRKKAVRSVH